MLNRFVGTPIEVEFQGELRPLQLEAVSRAVQHDEGILCAHYIGEGFDDARLDTLFLAMPISWKGTLRQYVGRLHRLHDNKRVVQVYDYVDDWVPMLERMYERRLKGYSSIGYTNRPGGFHLSYLTAPLICGHTLTTMP
jgi:superfamily II DNA or RNA helicase